MKHKCIFLGPWSRFRFRKRCREAECRYKEWNIQSKLVFAKMKENGGRAPLKWSIVFRKRTLYKYIGQFSIFIVIYKTFSFTNNSLKLKNSNLFNTIIKKYWWNYSIVYNICNVANYQSSFFKNLCWIYRLINTNQHFTDTYLFIIYIIIF